MKKHFVRLPYRSLGFDIHYTYDKELSCVEIVDIELEGIDFEDFFDDELEKIEKIILADLIKQSEQF